MADLATLALNNLRKVINDREVKNKDIDRALRPLMTIEWTLPTIRLIGSNLLNNTLRLLRSTTPPSEKYRTFAKTVTEGIRKLEQELPEGWYLWLLRREKFAVTDLIPMDKIRAITNGLADIQILTPWELALNTKTGINYIRSQDPSLEGIEIIWRSAKSWIDYIDTPRTTPLITSADQVLELISSIKAERIYLSQVSIENNRRKRQLDLPESYDKLTPSGKTKAIADLRPSAQGLTQFLDSQARINILRGVQGSLRSVASGITSYVKFCSAVMTTPFPVIPLTINRWSATFNCGKTFGLYVNHVKKGISPPESMHLLARPGNPRNS